MRTSSSHRGVRRSVTLATAVIAALLTSAVPAAPAAADPISDPIPNDPVASTLGLVLTPYASFPRSVPNPAPVDERLVRIARINTIMEIPDGSGRRAVPDLNGNLYTVRNGVPRVYLNVAAAFAPNFFSGRGLGQGFGYVTFHPDFRRNGVFYTIHTELKSSTTPPADYSQDIGTYQGVITEWTAADPAAETFAGTHREVLRIGFDGQLHGIQEINFNPTATPGTTEYGLLYIAVGDGGIGFRNSDPQDLGMLNGKVLRIDPRGSNSPNGRYGIPAGNPFVGQGRALGEIYALGFRDPHRFSWDSATGRMYLGHIGEHTIEAIDEVRAGDNFGWSVREGAFIFDSSFANPCDRIFALTDDDAGYTYPVAAYDHNPPPNWNCTSDLGVAVAGGFVYRGDTLPVLRGKYIFGDLVDGRVFYTETAEMQRGGPLATIHVLQLFDPAGTRVVMRDLSGPGSIGDARRVDLRFGTDARGELYLLSKANGRIWQVTGTRTAAVPTGRAVPLGR